MLDRAGFSCLTCTSSPEAIGILERESVDLVIADIHMPGNAGLEFVQMLSERTGMPPVILITGMPSIETASKAVRLKVIDYVLKPVDPDRLVDLAREGVAASRVIHMMGSHRARIEKSLEEMNRCEKLVRNALQPTANDALNTFLTISIQQALDTIADVGDLAQYILESDPAGDSQRRLQSAKPLRLVEAIRETIQVLENTKNSFKSRELGELRKKLEILVSQRIGSQP